MNEGFCLKIIDDVTLRCPTFSMAESAFEAIETNRAHIGEFLDFVEYTQELKDEKEFILKQLAEMEKGTVFQAFILDKEQVIGSVDLHFIDQKLKKAEIGYWLAKEYTRKEITTQAVTKLISYAFTKIGLNKLMIKAQVDNTGSNAVARSCGFRHVGILKEDILLYEEFQDANYYELTKKDWQY